MPGIRAGTRSVVLALLLLPGVVVPSAPQSATTPPQPSLVLRASTYLVRVEVVVRDRGGKPVTGLQAADFDVREDGASQRVEFFSSGPHADATREPLPPGMVSNQPDLAGPRRGLTVVLIDSLNTAWEHRAQAVVNLRKFLEGAHPDDRIAIYTLGNELKVFHEFTSDARALRRKLDRFDSEMGEGRSESSLLDAVLSPEAAALRRWASGTEEEARATMRAETTFEALETIANHLGSTPGWKSLVWISGGVPLHLDAGRPLGGGMGSRATSGGRSFEPEFDRAVRAFTRSNVAVYPIDPSGLQDLPVSSGGWRALQTTSMLEQLAASTGGVAYTGRNDILQALRRVTDDAQASYTLAYYPVEAKPDGRFRKIQVRVKKNGLVATHRRGYYAAPPRDPAGEDPAKAVRAMARAVLDEAVIGVAVGLDASPDGPRLIARIDAAELLWPDENAFKAAAHVGVFQYDSAERELAGVVDEIHLTCDASRAALLSKHGLAYNRQLDLNPATVRIKMVVRSVRTGAAGTVNLPVLK